MCVVKKNVLRIIEQPLILYVLPKPDADELPLTACEYELFARVELFIRYFNLVPFSASLNLPNRALCYKYNTNIDSSDESQHSFRLPMDDEEREFALPYAPLII